MKRFLDQSPLAQELKKLDPTKSLYDQSRDTVGKIYRDAQMNSDGTPVIVGDMGAEMTKSLVEDINDALAQYDKKGKPYYLLVHEKKDLQMKSALLRRMLYFGYRPWPEDDTLVFYKNPKTQDLRFCWCLPHHTEMDNMLMNPDQFDKEMIEQIKAWKAFDLVPFGFYKDPKEGWLPNPKHQFRKIDSYRSASSNILSSA